MRGRLACGTGALLTATIPDTAALYSQKSTWSSLACIQEAGRRHRRRSRRIHICWWTPAAPGAPRWKLSVEAATKLAKGRRAPRV